MEYGVKTWIAADEAGRKNCVSVGGKRWTLMDFEVWLMRNYQINPKFKVLHDHRGEHWLWEGMKSRHGYGIALYRGKHVYIHRLSMEATEGELPPRKHVRHRCQHHNCATRWHLLLGTAKENARDKREQVR